MAQRNIIWYGVEPLPGVVARLEERGFMLILRPTAAHYSDSFLGVTSIVVFCYHDPTEIAHQCKHVPSIFNHGVRMIVVADRPGQVETEQILKKEVCSAFDWKRNVIFIPNLLSTNFDNFIELPTVLKWKALHVRQDRVAEPLNNEADILVHRAFPNADELHITPMTPGRSGSNVFLVYEKRREKSIAHWAQPRLVKIGPRDQLEVEVGNMRAVSPFVPFELRPNLDIHVEGFKKSLFVADFVERSESLLEAAHAGRAEGAISNLFNRTLYRWRDRGWQSEAGRGSLVEAAERLGIMSPEKIDPCYRENERIEKQEIDFDGLWGYLKGIKFAHRMASIHGDLHGENVRVRGDDAILIDLGSVKGAEKGDAPLCFDVAMLEVALIFSLLPDSLGGNFQDAAWEERVRPYYTVDALRRTPRRDHLPAPTSWEFGCIQRIRAFSMYDQSDEDEYAIALAICLWRWCKFKHEGAADKGRRVVALEIGAKIIMQIQERRK